MTSPYAKTSAAMLTKNANSDKMSESQLKPSTKMSRKKADELAMRDETPLDVMIENMLFWRNQANNLHAILMEKIEMLHLPEGVADAQGHIEKIVGQIKEVGSHFLQARSEAQRCAVDAAPYVHPKISPTKLKGSEGAAVRLIQAQTPPHEAMASYLESLQIVSIEMSQGADANEAVEDVAS